MFEWKEHSGDRLTRRDIIMWLNGVMLGVAVGAALGITLTLI